MRPIFIVYNHAHQTRCWKDAKFGTQYSHGNDHCRIYHFSSQKALKIIFEDLYGCTHEASWEMWIDSVASERDDPSNHPEMFLWRAEDIFLIQEVISPFCNSHGGKCKITYQDTKMWTGATTPFSCCNSDHHIKEFSVRWLLDVVKTLN